MLCQRMLRRPAVEDRRGIKCTRLYHEVKAGLMTPPVKLTTRTSAWPESEVDAINQARIAGRSDSEIRELVKRLIAARKQVA